MHTSHSQIDCPLSDLQLRILKLTADGYVARETGKELGYSTKYIENQLAYARDATGARNTTHLVAIAKDRKWL